MEGGAPEGIKMRPEEDGCLTKRNRIRMTTMQGNSRTKPSGIDIDELPFIRILRRKNDHRGKLRPFSLLKSSSDGMFVVEGIRLTSPCTNPMSATLLATFMQRFWELGLRRSAVVSRRFATEQNVRDILSYRSVEKTPRMMYAVEWVTSVRAAGPFSTT